MSKPIELREADFVRMINDKLKYPNDLKNEFIQYWSEKNKSGTKMRWELEKTWDTERRLTRWANNNFTPKRTEIKGFQTEKQKEPTTEIEFMDRFLIAYRKHPTNFQFIDLAIHYDWLKEKQLMKKFTKGEIEHIKTCYPNDNQKCRAACVYETLKNYANNNLLFSDLLNKR